jgi:hypothetical protein
VRLFRRTLAAQPCVQVDSVPLGQELNDEFGVADRFAVELYPRVLAFRSLSRVVLNHLFVWDFGQLKPSEQLDREWSCRGQAPVRRESEDAKRCHDQALDLALGRPGANQQNGG